ncbi:lactonase family protein [Amycolatopsis echigonensis]|uniref:6-phosphogluconolactonase (Cycloisomerase 2 family) n=1 Tax=Amycolatopsis echigonensis TaxID=2576905 RepID=A0A2N3WHC7_9PSEU|nr:MULTISPECIES: beta-propeller fold lactonase family protein [Amycolatopsis]MBB2499028.1 lactonase family protein [Amycolatopsis echigonensis]PKV93270.1 6-phosphogluconolactonase (cycloisomerase 2 family) [Amycolatopsis niigatensis]
MSDVVLVGCRTAETGGNGTGIAVFRRSGGELTADSTVPMVSPTWLTQHPALPMVYAVNETSYGEITSVSVDDGLTPLDVVESGGASPCHLAVTPDGRFLLCANYGGGSLAVFALHSDGRIDGRTDLVQHTGSGPRADRQEGPHVHMAVPSADSSVVSAVDLGTDEIRSYTLSPQGKLTPLAVSPLPPGTGPRQLMRGANGIAYVAGELSGELITMRETSPGEFEFVAATPSTAAGGESLVAHLEVLESGIYLSNRGPECITSFAGSPLRAVADQPCGSYPWNFAVTDGLCFTAAFKDDVISVFPLKDLGNAEVRKYPTGSPTCVLPLR